MKNSKELLATAIEEVSEQELKDVAGGWHPRCGKICSVTKDCWIIC